MGMNILQRLFPNKYEIYCMAQRQGGFDNFEFYQLDNGRENEPPHTHLCVKKGTKGFKGKNLVSGNPFMSVFKIKLNPDCNYNEQNITVLEDYGNNFNKVKDKVIKWLNTAHHGQKCLQDYLLSNGFGKFQNEYEEEVLKFIECPDDIKNYQRKS